MSALQVVHRLLPPEIVEERKQKTKPAAPVQHKPRHDGIKVQGLDDILINFARCCHPLPGDSIVGYITRGRGVTVHTTDCLSVDKLEYDPERRVPVEWDLRQDTTHPARITVVTHDQQGVLAGVSSAIAACNGNISRATVTTSQEKKAYLEFTVDIRDVICFYPIHATYFKQRFKRADGFSEFGWEILFNYLTVFKNTLQRRTNQLAAPNQQDFFAT